MLSLAVPTSAPAPTEGDDEATTESAERDGRSIYVGNVRAAKPCHHPPACALHTPRVSSSSVAAAALLRRQPRSHRGRELRCSASDERRRLIHGTHTPFHRRLSPSPAVLRGTVDFTRAPRALPRLQVDYSVTPEDLQEHFESAGVIEKITIPTDVFKSPKG